MKFKQEQTFLYRIHVILIRSVRVLCNGKRWWRRTSVAL